MRHIIVAAVLALSFMPAVHARQVEVDRSVGRVYGTVIMSSDVRQARMLKLGSAGADTDAAVQTMMENRLLMLREASQGNAPEPAADAIAARRDEWRRTWPASTDLPGLLSRAGMSDQALDGWFRDEVRIAAYLDQRFPPGSDPRRADRINAWISELRRRANLSAK